MTSRSSPTSTLRITIATSPNEWSGHLAAWHSLADEPGSGEWWAGPLWQVPFFRHILPRATPFMIFAYREDRMVGALPLRQRTGNDFPRALSSLRHAHVRRTGWLQSESAPEALRTMLLTAVSRSTDGAVHLAQLERGSAMSNTLTGALAPASLTAFSIGEAPSAVADLADGWDAYEQSRDSKFLRSVRRYERKQPASEGWRVQCFSTENDLANAWRAVLDIETRSWKQATGTSMANEPGTGALYRDVAESFAQRGRLRLHILYHEQKPVAHALAVVDKGTTYLLKNSYCESYKSVSPGVTLVWHAMRSAHQQDHCTRFDFLGVAAEWKLPFSTQTPAYESVTVFPRHHLGWQTRRVWEMVMKPRLRPLRQLLRGGKPDTGDT